MNVFLDTSALAKRYIEEEGSDKVNTIFRQAQEIFVSVLSLPEFFSALNRLKRQKCLSKKQYQQIKKAFMREFKYFCVCDLTETVVAGAVRLLETLPLKTLDALHLASARAVGADLFISSDDRQTKAAKETGLAVKRI